MSSTAAVDHVAAFNAAHDDLMAFVRDCPEADWSRPVPIEERTVGVMADHLAEGYLLASGWIENATSGKPIPGTIAENDAENARHARERSGVTREEVLARLEERAPRVRAALHAAAALSPDTAVYFGPAGADMALAGLMSIASGHVTRHLAHVREALASS